MQHNSDSNTEVLLQALIEHKPDRSCYFYLQLMNVLVTKAPLVLFEGYEYVCDYSHQTDHSLKPFNIWVISAFSSVLVILLFKRCCEYKTYQLIIADLITEINTNARLLIDYHAYDNQSDGDNNLLTCLEVDFKHTELIRKLTGSNFVRISPLLQRLLGYEKYTKPKSKLRGCPNSHTCLEVIETLDLWLGIVWLAYCFINHFHESAMTWQELSIIFSTAAVYLLLHFSLPHSDLGKSDCQNLSKLSTFFTVHAQYLQPSTTRYRGESMPEEYRVQRENMPRRAHSF